MRGMVELRAPIGGRDFDFDESLREVCLFLVVVLLALPNAAPVIHLGDSSVTILTTPGHTPGTLSMIFQVKHTSNPLTVVYSGGTAFNFPSTGPNFDIYIQSQAKLAVAAVAAGATVFMSNHTEFDGALPKIKMIAPRKPGESHPFEIGKEAIVRYFIIGKECGEAAKFRFADAK
jgi:metallo-beta-lactamase class B